MTIVAVHPAEKNVLRRARQVARFYNGGGQVDVATAVGLLLDRLEELEQKVARIAVALNDNGRRAS